MKIGFGVRVSEGVYWLTQLSDEIESVLSSKLEAADYGPGVEEVVMGLDLMDGSDVDDELSGPRYYLGNHVVETDGFVLEWRKPA
ncbi:hypothetical protein [Lysobacter niastensis]|uniref:Uncharacterized protein n=1 Tax=Lysobacter niastensis TaxID=380629 RepID=A0ABS0BBP3_9GAMM|nr:hypothetical protein [Lysobacter niastensis]MBF6025161.1 hypothetical protein [Lysobacter niastensis]